MTQCWGLRSSQLFSGARWNSCKVVWPRSGVTTVESVSLGRIGRDRPGQLPASLPHGLWEALGTHTASSTPGTPFAPGSSPHRRTSAMAPTGLLQQLHYLNRSSSAFHDQLSSILYGEGFKQQALNLQSDGLVWLVDYLDNVRRRVSFIRSPLKRS